MVTAPWMAGSSVGRQGEGLGEAAVLGGDDPAPGEQPDEVVLDRLGAVLLGEGGGRLARPRQADDQHGLLALGGRDDLAAGVHGQPAALVDLAVPHPQAALFRLPEVVGVEHPGDAGLQVDGDDPVVGVAGGGQVGGVDHGDLGLVAGVAVDRVVVEEPLHAGDVGVGLLDDQPGRGAVGPGVADEAVDHHHVLAADVLVLEGGESGPFLAVDGLVAVLVGPVGDHVGRPLGAGDDLGLHVDVAVRGLAGLGHGVGVGAQLGLGRVKGDRLGGKAQVGRWRARHQGPPALETRSTQSSVG